MDLLAGSVADVAEQEKTRQAILLECVNELARFSRLLVQHHYAAGQKIKDIAIQLKCSVDSAYKTLQRARLELRRCLDRKLRERERA